MCVQRPSAGWPEVKMSPSQRLLLLSRPSSFVLFFVTSLHDRDSQRECPTSPCCATGSRRPCRDAESAGSRTVITQSLSVLLLGHAPLGEGCSRRAPPLSQAPFWIPWAEQAAGRFQQRQHLSKTRIHLMRSTTVQRLKNPLKKTEGWAHGAWSVHFCRSQHLH